jgi:dihydrofolate reductase
MRKVIAFMHVSLDGFVAGTNGELGWVSHGEDIKQYVDQLIGTTDTAMYGRTTYQMMHSYWPTVSANPASLARDVAHANWVENVTKIVFSRSLDHTDWNNTTLVKDQIPQTIANLKTQAGKSLMIFGSPRLTHSFMELDLIDEYRLTINPVILGTGIPLFTNTAKPNSLKLLETQTFESGVIAVVYERIKASFEPATENSRI